MLSTSLHNLVGNAVKYTDRGGVLVGCRHRGTALWIEIYDSGIGIPDNQVETIFGEFQQLDAKREGLGLGLWIARSTADTLGHDLSVRSVLGRGSRFRLVVPLVTAVGANDSTILAAGTRGYADAAPSSCAEMPSERGLPALPQ
jgi:signal transduction histidine kinase